MTTTKNKRSYENRSRSSYNHLALSFSKEANRRVEYGYLSFIPTAMIQRATGPHEDLLTIIKRRKLQWYGHLPFIRSGQNHLARHCERGKKTRQTEGEVGRQHREWTSLEFAKSQRAVENREEWRKLIVKSSVVPQ